MTDIRRTIAGRLIRLAHKIYPPRVTTVNYNINCTDAGRAIGRDLFNALQYDRSNLHRP